MSQVKRLFLVRHAHRDTSSGREIDNGLSDKGKLQADLLAEFFRHLEIRGQVDSSRLALLTSPYQRCVETIQPVSENFGIKFLRQKSLRELQPGETMHKFSARLISLLEDWNQSEDQSTVFCSHGDVLPMMLEQLTGKQIWLKKGAVAVIAGKRREIELELLIQRLNLFF